MFSKFKKTKKAVFASVASMRFAYLGGLILTILLILQMYQLYSLREKLAFIDGLQESQSSVVSQLSLSQSYLSQFGQDLNQIRQFLLLPTRDYNFAGLDSADLSQKEPDLSAGIFDLLIALGEAEQNVEIYEDRKIQINEYIAGLESVLKEKSLMLTQENSESAEVWTLKDSVSNEDFLRIYLSADGKLDISNLYASAKVSTTEEDLSPTLDEMFGTYIQKSDEIRSIFAKRANVLEALESDFFASDNFQTYLNENLLTLENRKEEENFYIYELKNADQKLLASFLISKTDASMQLDIEGKLLQFDALDYEKVLNEMKSKIDPRTALQVKIESMRAELDSLAQDKGFLGTLKKFAFNFQKLEGTSLQDHYVLLNQEGGVIINLYFDLSTGEIFVAKPDSELKSLKDFTELLSLSSKKKL